VRDCRHFLWSQAFGIDEVRVYHGRRALGVDEVRFYRGRRAFGVDGVRVFHGRRAFGVDEVRLSEGFGGHCRMLCQLQGLSLRTRDSSALPEANQHTVAFVFLRLACACRVLGARLWRAGETTILS
jgi:hypothetical protein